MSTMFADKVLQFNQRLSKTELKLPQNFKLINPFNGENKKQINEISTMFYKKFYNDDKKRYMILGSSPARRGTAITGVPFEDDWHLRQETGICIDDFHINKASSGFLYEVIDRYGGCEKFYSKFYMNFICPLGVVRTTTKGNCVNCNYYESKNLEKSLYDFIVKSLKEQLSFNIDTSICYCIGSGENYKFLLDLNNKFNLFDSIVPLEHPRFIMQYNSKNKENYLNKYLNALTTENAEQTKSFKV